MAIKVDSHSVDPRVIAAWKAALKSVDEKNLQEFAIKHKQLNAGFRHGKVSLQILVGRVQAMLDQSKELPIDLRSLLSSATLSRKLISVFSDEAIIHTLPSLANAFGRLNIYAALLLDERLSIRNIGVKLIEGWDGNETDELSQKAGQLELKHLLTPFLSQISVLTFNEIDKVRETSSINDSRLLNKRRKSTEKLIVDYRASRTELNRTRRSLTEVTNAHEKANAVRRQRV